MSRAELIQVATHLVAATLSPQSAISDPTCRVAKVELALLLARELLRQVDAPAPDILKVEDLQVGDRVQYRGHPRCAWFDCVVVRRGPPPEAYNQSTAPISVDIAPIDRGHGPSINYCTQGTIDDGCLRRTPAGSP